MWAKWKGKSGEREEGEPRFGSQMEVMRISAKTTQPTTLLIFFFFLFFLDFLRFSFFPALMP